MSFFKCYICSKSFISYQSICAHFVRVHPTHKTEECEQCENFQIARYSQQNTEQTQSQLLSINQNLDSPSRSFEDDTNIGQNSNNESHQTSLVSNIVSFYHSYSYQSSDLYPNLRPLNPEIHLLPKSVEELIQYCCDSMLSTSQSVGLYDLQVKREKHEGGAQALVSSFSSSRAFSNYMHLYKKWKMNNGGWKQANIYISEF